MTTNSVVGRIDPVSGLVAYVEEIKPFHTKIIEVLVEYIHTDCIDVTITEDFELALGVPSDPSKWGWTEAEAARMFNDNWSNYQLTAASSVDGYWEIVGDFKDDFEIGETILLKLDNGFSEYTITTSTLQSTTVNGEIVKTTRIYVSESIPTHCHLTLY